jgi:hypothetical protein
MAWGDTPRATIGLKPLISYALTGLSRALGLLKPHVSLIYTYFTKSIVTGTDIKFSRIDNFRGLLLVGPMYTSRCARNQVVGQHS